MTDDERDKRTPEIITYTWWEINIAHGIEDL